MHCSPGLDVIDGASRGSSNGLEGVLMVADLVGDGSCVFSLVDAWTMNPLPYSHAKPFLRHTWHAGLVSSH